MLGLAWLGLGYPALYSEHSALTASDGTCGASAAFELCCFSGAVLLSQHQDNITVARRVFEAYLKRDRAGVEALLAEDFRFTSPLDNKLDRTRYMSHCWPAGQDVEQFEFIHLLAAGDQVFVTYEGRRTGGDRFRNTEILTVKHGRVTEVEVYFGWSLPHPAAPGSYVGNDA
jgi:ketosteroid isomerase-like protein